jgi:hypothetical protein
MPRGGFADCREVHDFPDDFDPILPEILKISQLDAGGE